LTACWVIIRSAFVTPNATVYTAQVYTDTLIESTKSPVVK